MSLYCSVQGEGENLVLLHGWGMNSAVWQGLLPHVQGRYRTHCIDLPGHGASGDAEAGLAAWLNALDAVLPEQFYLCGWSLGGMLALALQQRWPQRVQGVAMLAASPRFLASEGWSALPASQLEVFAQGLKQDAESTLRQFIALQFLGTADSRAVQRELWRALQEQGLASQRGLQQGLQLLQRLDLRDNYAGMTCATLLGGRDKLVPPALQLSMQALAPRSCVELWADSGHAPHLTQPAEVAQFIFRHLHHKAAPE